MLNIIFLLMDIKINSVSIVLFMYQHALACPSLSHRKML